MSRGAFLAAAIACATAATTSRESPAPAARRMAGRDFVLHYSLPHLFFHATTAYDLLRHSGLPLAKRDFMGQVQGIIEG